MARSVILLLIGAIAGGAGVVLFGGSTETFAPAAVSPTEPAVAQSAVAPEPDRLPVPPAPGSESFAGERLAIYSLAAAVDDASDLESLIRTTVAEPESRSRELRLSALLARLAELDPRRAIDAARSQYLDTKYFMPLFAAWADVDEDAAIAGLAVMAPGSQQRELALAVLDVIGNSKDGVAQIAAVLPAGARAPFELDALIARARVDPAGVLAEALAAPATIRQNFLLTELAEQLVRSDPVGALALAESIDNYAQRESFMSRVLSGWAELDPEGAFAWLENASPAELNLSAAMLYLLARSDPARVMAMIDTLPASLRTTATSAATQALADQSPEAAMAMLQTMPVGQERDRLISAIAGSLAEQNPQQALAWARGLQPPSPDAIRSVLRAITQRDPQRGLELIMDELETLTANDITSVASTLSLVMSLGSGFGRETPDLRPVLDRMLALNNPTLDSMIASTVGSWARSDGEAAFNWALANSGRIDVATFRTVAQRVAATDLNGALDMLNRVPAENKTGWFSGLVQELVRQDPQRAIDTLDRLQGAPGYGTAFATVAREMGRADPAAAAAMLVGATGVAANELIAAASTIASEWAAREPGQAAAWVASLEGTPLQSQAMASVAQRWAMADAGEARQWLLSVQRGPERDAALRSYLSVAAQSAGYEPDVIAAFSNEQAAQQALVTAIAQVGRNDVDEARRLMDAYVQDPALRRSLEDTLARTGGAGSSMIVTSSGLILN